MSGVRRAGVLVVLLLLPRAGAQSGSPADAPPGLAQQAVLAPFLGDWDQIRKRRMLRALVVYSRILYFVDRGRQRGLSYQLLEAFEDEINARLKTKTLRFHVVFIPVPRDQLIPALLDGRGDIAAGKLVVTPGTSEKIAFTASLLDEVDELVVTGPSGTRVASLEDLSGKPVHVRRSSSYWEHLEGLNRQLVASGKPPVELVPASEDLEDEDLLEMVNAGLIPTTVCDGYQLAFWKRFLPALVFEPAVAVSRGGSFAWMVRKDNPQLKAVADGFVKRHRKGTTFGNMLYQQFQKRPRSVLAATSGSELRKFQQMEALFRKYGKKYDVDYLLMMAQGYQESRLDQSVRSRAGAIGVMQLLPSTGTQMRVGDIHQLEPNIHAGVKYLRHMEDIYFAEPALDPMVKALFVFASYNAGPNRIQSLRREATRRGLDPDRWFKNVEYVVADKVGQETVTYVANIFKYYLAYQRVAAAEQDRAAARQSLERGNP